MVSHLGRKKMSLKIEQVHKYFVGEVSGIDLSDPLSKSEVTEIEEGMDQFGVLIFREQFLSDEEQVSYTKNFGELELHVGSNVLKGNERRLSLEFADVSNLDQDGEILKLLPPCLLFVLTSHSPLYFA